MTISITSEGRRHYLVGDTYPIKGAIRSAGCKWDPERKAWWTGKRETAESIVASVATGAVQARASYTKLGDGSWGVRVPGTIAVGATAEVETRSGAVKSETIAAIVQVDGDRTICSVVQRERITRSNGRTGYGYGRRTGCYCGSREDSSGELIPSPRNCKQCHFDAYDC